jgi:hypothetical protein
MVDNLSYHIDNVAVNPDSPIIEYTITANPPANTGFHNTREFTIYHNVDTNTSTGDVVAFGEWLSLDDKTAQAVYLAAIRSSH